MPPRRTRRSQQDQQVDLALDAANRMMQTPQGRQALLIIVIVGVLAFAGWWLWENRLRPRHPVGPTVRLATWNLRQFSDKRKGVDLRTIARIINDNHFDLIAVQEVKRDGEEVDKLLNTLGSPWRAAHLSDTTGNYERFAFLYNADHVQETGSAHFIATADITQFDRWPYQGTFRAGNFEFTLITCHLSYTDVKRREQEAQTLANFATKYAQTSSVKDIIVCGDFNEEPPHENLHYFTSQGWESLNHDPSNLGGTQTFDTFLIEPSATTEWTGTAASVHFDEQLFGNNDKAAEEQVSDHRPVYADFVTNLPGGNH